MQSDSGTCGKHDITRRTRRNTAALARVPPPPTEVRGVAARKTAKKQCVCCFSKVLTIRPHTMLMCSRCSRHLLHLVSSSANAEALGFVVETRCKSARDHPQLCILLATHLRLGEGSKAVTVEQMILGLVGPLLQAHQQQTQRAQILQALAERRTGESQGGVLWKGHKGYNERNMSLLATLGGKWASKSMNG